MSNHNNFAKALSIVASDSTSYYVLGYRPSNPTVDGRFRKIEVRVQRKGVKVRARKGYFATAGGAR